MYARMNCEAVNNLNQLTSVVSIKRKSSSSCGLGAPIIEL